MGASLLGLGNVGDANGVRCNTYLSDVFLQSVLHFVELVIDSIQSIACNLLVLAQILGIAIYGYITHLDIGNDWIGSLGTYLGGLESYPACGGVDANRSETIENN